MGKLADLDFDRTLFWVQMFNLPLACMSREVGEVLGSLLGEVKEVDVGANGSCWGKCLRVRILIDITQPLQRGLQAVIGDDGEEASVLLCYERLPNFCFLCGRMGHLLRECAEAKGVIKDAAHLKFGSWLRAQGYSKSVYPGNRRIVSESHSADASEETAAGSMDGKTTELDGGASQNAEGDSSLVRSTETGSNQQIQTDCVIEEMETSVIAKEAVPDPPPCQDLLAASMSAASAIKKGKNKAFSDPIHVGPVRCDTPDPSCSGVPEGANNGSVVSSNSVSMPLIFEPEEAGPNVVSSPRKRSWKRLARNNAVTITTEPVQLGKRSINFEVEENGQSRKRRKSLSLLPLDLAVSGPQHRRPL
ncbi:hypothetical protein ACOSQ2_015077 [Xanthoceras sorbifolium]